MADGRNGLNKAVVILFMCRYFHSGSIQHAKIRMLLTHQHKYSIMAEVEVPPKVRRIEMNFYLTDQLKKKLDSVQSIPMKHCAEYGV